MKPTRATLKSFVKKNAGKLFISVRSSFDGMVDGCTDADDKSFRPAQPATFGRPENNLGISGVWLVGGGRDHITPFSEPGYMGHEIYNCCGCFRIAIKER